MTRRACLRCGTPFTVNGRQKSYCTTHQPKDIAPALRGYDSEWVKRSKQLRAEHISKYGDVCLGTEWCDIRNVAHVCYTLVLDHDLGIMCRVANSRKGGGFDKAPGKLRGGNRQRLA